MNLLAIESATDAVGAALVRDNGAVAERVHAGGREHAERLIPIIEEVCASAGCPLSDVGVVAVDVGPGLFTGLRVGVATAKALAQARRIGLVGVGSLDVLAAAGAGVALAAGLGRVETVVPVVDARRGEVFAATYHLNAAAPLSSGVCDVAPAVDDRPEPLAPDELVEWLVAKASGPGSMLLVGDGADRYRHLLAVNPELDLGHAASLSAPPPEVLGRLAVARLSAGAVPVAPDVVVPDYRRPADARINWEQRAVRPAAPAAGGSIQR